MPTRGGGTRPAGNRRGRDLRQPLLPGRGPLAGAHPVVGLLGVLVVFAAGVIVGGPVGAVLLGLLAVGVAALLATTWARLGPAERFARGLILVVLVAVTIGVALR